MTFREFDKKLAADVDAIKTWDELREYLTGMVRKLYEYEKFGYTPEQLQKIIQHYNILKLDADSKLESMMQPSFTSVFPQIQRLADGVAEKKDRSLAIFVGPHGTSISIYPFTEDQEDEEI